MPATTGSRQPGSTSHRARAQDGLAHVRLASKAAVKEIKELQS